jgi:hypothetical protein
MKFHRFHSIRFQVPRLCSARSWHPFRTCCGKDQAVRIFRSVIIVQGSYTLLTAIWPLVDIESFMAVTGYKTDQWLVKTVGALLIPIAITLISYLFVKTNPTPAFVLGSLTSIALIWVDFYFSGKNVIPDIYQLDGWIEVCFLLAWIYLACFRFGEISRSVR